MTYPTLDQWVTSFFPPNSQMKFQLSPAPAGSFEKETLVVSPIILVITTDRAVTVRERDPDG